MSRLPSYHRKPQVEKICARDDCGAAFKTRSARKRFCSERCQRIAEKRRYRSRHVEVAVCANPDCRGDFQRSVVDGERQKVYCSLECQATHRSVEYASRPDIVGGPGRGKRGHWAGREGRLREAHSAL
jgi:predicted nucleic acid-binding Zn ribbon protein